MYTQPEQSKDSFAAKRSSRSRSSNGKKDQKLILNKMLFMKGMGEEGKGELVDRFSTYEVIINTTSSMAINIVMIAM